MPLFLMGCFPVDFQDVKRPLRTKSVKRPIKVGERPINEGKRPIKAKVLVGVSVGSLMGCFRAPPPWRKTAPLKRPIKRSMKIKQKQPQVFGDLTPPIPVSNLLRTLREGCCLEGCELFFPLEGPRSHPAGNPRKMGKTLQNSPPRSDPRKWGQLPQKRHKISPKMQFFENFL